MHMKGIMASVQCIGINAIHGSYGGECSPGACHSLVSAKPPAAHTALCLQHQHILFSGEDHCQLAEGGDREGGGASAGIGHAAAPLAKPQ